MSETTKPRLDELLKAAGQPTRLRILNLLRRGSTCVCDIQSVLGLPQPTVSRHLAALRHVGLVTDTREGPRVMYSLAAPSSKLLASFYEFLAETCIGEAQPQEDLKALDDAPEPGEGNDSTRKEWGCEPAPPGYDASRQPNSRRAVRK